MDINFFLVQGIGVFAWLVLVASYYGKTTNNILIVHVLSSILYCVHYYLLGAYSGVLICAFEALRDFLYYKTDLDNYIFYGSVPFYVFNGMITFTGWHDLLPAFASLVDGYTLTKKKNVVILGAIVAYSAWIIYDIYVGSYSCAITNGILVLSNLCILLFDFNPFKWNSDVGK